jgi:NAD(P)-dependent dehydrogenase (short-subunit alcohol dehydrogenase family)
MCAKAAYPTFKRGGCGKIINIGSMMSIFGASFAPAYAASKGGIVQLTRSLASAWARDNIQANAVLPGWIDTDLTRGAREQVPGLHENVLRRTPAAPAQCPQFAACQWPFAPLENPGASQAIASISGATNSRNDVVATSRVSHG